MSTDKIPTYCMQCVCGPDLLTVEVDGKGDPIGVQPNFDAEDIHPANGRVCTKAYSLIDKVNNPKRIQQPMVRTNPAKGWEEPPEWKEISWEEAISILAEKINDAQKDGFTDESGYPNIAVTMGGGGISEAHFGTMPAFLGALDGYVDMSLGSGQGVACYHSEHIYHELWHRGFLGVPDVTEAELVISFGANKQNTAGASGNRKYTQARDEGDFEYIHIEPHSTTSAGWADDWIPIKPKTDAIFLHAMLHVVLHELDWNDMVDHRFLKNRTNSPYLIGPDGYFLRDHKSEKPLIWDRSTESAKPYDADIQDPSLTGTYSVSGITVGPDDETSKYDRVEVVPAFEKLRDQASKITPEEAAEICDVPASRIRNVAQKFANTAAKHVGDTIEVNGVQLPYRPVGILLGKTVNNGWGGYQTSWTRMALCSLFGAVEVPGGLVSVGSRLNPPYYDKNKSVTPGKDGFMKQNLCSTKKDDWPEKPKTRGGLTELTPLVGKDGWAQALAPSTLAWKFQNEAPDNWPQPDYPDVWINYRANPVVSFPDTELVTNAVANFPFTVDIAYTEDETNWFADLILPDHTDLEGLQLKRIGGHNHAMDAFWETEGFALKQPVTEPEGNTIDMTNLWTRLTREIGCYDEYIKSINEGYIMGVPLKNDEHDYTLDPDEEYSREDIWNQICRAATRQTSNGKEEKSLDWFKQNGFYVRDFPKVNHYLHPTMVDQGLRYEFPYQERVKRMGSELKRRLHENDVKWWDEQLEEYQPMPDPEDPSNVWEQHYGEEYEYWALTTKSMHYSYSNNVTNEISSEVAQHTQEFEGICINQQTAESYGVESGDQVIVKSPYGEKEADVIVREGVRPDVVLFVGQFGHSITPHAKNLRIPNINRFTTVDDFELIDGTGSIAQLGKVTIEPKE